MYSREQALLDRVLRLSSQPDCLKNDRTRKQMLQLSEQLAANLRAPEDVSNEVIYYPIYAFAVRVAIDMNLFYMIDQCAVSTSARSLSIKCGASCDLIARTLRVLSAMGFIDELGEDRWTTNEVTKVMCRPEAQAAHIHKWTNCNGTMIKMLDYLKQTGYKTPTDPANGPFQYAFQTEKSAFEYWREKPEIASNFNTFMKGKRASRPDWTSWWPVESRLLQPEDLDTSHVVLVDVGGGRGHDIECFREKFPNKGRLVLEDLPAVIDDIRELHGQIERVKYDFFKPQVVKGARIYYFGMIFHDWSDDFCLKILSGTVSAMKPGYSKLLIDDAVLPAQGCPAILGALDLAMMAMHSGKERTERQWADLLHRAGLKITKFWPYDASGSGIIETDLL